MSNEQGVLYNIIMNKLPPKPKKPQFIPVPLILVALFILLIILIGHFTAAPGKKLTILHTNDLQGELLPFTEEIDGKKVEIGGFARIATIVNDQKERNDNVILLDAGDTIQGTLFTRIRGGKDIGQLMSEIGYDAVTIGEHDFDKGPEGLREYIMSATYPFLAANIDISKSDVLKDDSGTSLIVPYVIIDMAKDNPDSKLKVGILGLTTEDANVFAKTGPNVEITDPKQAARKVIDEIQNKCDIIIALSHLGLTGDRKLAAAVSGIDIIIGGGSKTKLTVPVKVTNPSGNKTIIVQAKNQGRFIGKLDVAVKNDSIKLLEYRLIPLDESVTPDIKYSEEIDQLKKELLQEAQKPIGETKVPLNVIKSNIRTSETNMGDLFAEAIKAEFPEVDIALQNSGGIRGDNIIQPGKLTMKEVYELHPFENKIILVTLTGKQIKEVLERGVSNLPISKGTFLQVAGLSYVVDLTGLPQELTEDNSEIKTPGDRVISIKINGKPIDYNKEYRVAINDFIYDGGDGFITFKNAKNVTHTQKSLTEIIIDYIKTNSPISIKTDGRIEVKGGLLK
jgi:2',3'-cyclic-nucleotide 2'-phosphodiesterase (5'-nucleotidase family)